MVMNVICAQEISDVTLVQRKRKLQLHLFAKGFFPLEEVHVGFWHCQAA